MQTNIPVYKFYALLSTVLVSVVLLIVILATVGEEKVKRETAHSSYEPVVENLLRMRISFLQDLVQSNVIVAAVETANVNNAILNIEQMHALDSSAQANAKVKKGKNLLLRNKATLTLIEFQEEYEGFPEIFITDRYGLNVAQTNPTSDYYQADEKWWQKVYNNGIGMTYYGQMEFDESAQVESIPLYIPIKNNEEVIGILKAVIDVAVLQQSLWKADITS